jgi:putative transposase
VSVLCKALSVSRSGFYAWSGREPSKRAQRDEQLRGQIREIHTHSRRTYGAPRIHAELVLEVLEMVARSEIQTL